MKQTFTKLFERVAALVIVLVLLICSPVAFAQSIKVTGTVSDAVDGSAIPGANVLIKGSTQGTTTDAAGVYSLDVSDPSSTLVFSFIGYTTQELEVSGRFSIDVVMEADTKTLGEVVVVGYGSQIEREVTGSVQQVKAEELRDLPVPQLAQKLQGRLAGVQITQTTGQPGQGMAIRIRGQASISAGNAPLYVVDGFPIVGDINHLNPNEIENITVLKDASSTSLYGSRAANGVILITTKRGKVGQTTVGVNGYYGVQIVPEKGRPDMMNAQEFAQFQKEVAEENGRAVDPVYQNPSQYGEGTDWYDVLFRAAKVEEYTLSLTSGSEKFKTAAVGGFFNQDGVMLNSNFKRFSLRLNADYDISDRVKVGFNVAPTYSVNNTPVSDGVWWTVPSIIQGAILTTPLAPYKDADGTIPLTATGPGLFGNPNWYNVLQVIRNETKTTRLLSNAFLTYEPAKDLVFKTSINVDLKDGIYNNFIPSTAGSLFNPPPRIPTAVQSSETAISWMSENTASYKKSVEDHNFDAIVGFTSQKFRSDLTYTAASDFPDDKIQTLNAATSTLTSSDVQEWALLSYLARVNYNYKGKYLLSLATRRDGSSRFGRDNKWGNFPSISVGWVISDESFIPQSNAMSFLKLRASYGIIGNNNIGNYTHLESVTNTNYSLNGVLASGRNITALGNADLGWEQTKQIDIGVDIGLLDDRIAVSYDYYSKNTSDLLYRVDVPLASGFSSVWTNIGEIKFWGHEFTVSSKNLVGNFLWNTDFNISFNNNKVLALGTENADIFGDFSITEVGKPIGQLYGMVMEGVYRNQTELDAYPKHVSSVVGSARMKDIDGDGVIETGDDRTTIGNPLPKFIFGLTNNFRYKNFDLTVVASGSYGNDIAYMTQEFTTNLDGVFNVEKEVANRWKSPEDPGNGKYGTTKAGATGLNRTFNTTYVYDGSYLAIKNLTLGYNLPIKNQKIARAVRVYASIQQALVLTNYKTLNPEVNSNRGGASADPLALGIDHSTYPVPRTYSFGLNLNF
jgi:TonB-linked SusC/RagA family outer membrane protein